MSEQNIEIRRRARVLAAGLCPTCRKTTPESGFKVCLVCRLKQRARNKSHMNKLRHQVYSAYGGKCICCGEIRFAFLTVDHVHGGGRVERQVLKNSYKLFTHLIKNEYPTSYQLMCFNCNCGRSRNGGVCPHQVAISTSISEPSIDSLT